MSSYKDEQEEKKEWKDTNEVNPRDIQVGGKHYNNKAIQPIDYIMENKLGFCEDSNKTAIWINKDLLNRLIYLGLIPTSIRSKNIGESNYSKKTIQPWSIWLDYDDLTSFDHDIIKRVLRDKKSDKRELDYQKIIHICEERLRQLSVKDNNITNKK